MAEKDSTIYYNSTKDVSMYDNLPAAELWWVHVDVHTVKTLIGDVTNKSILDLGCGSGRIDQILNQWGAAKIVGIDISATMIEKAKEKQIAGSDFVVQDLSDISDFPVIDQFDVVTTNYAMMYMSDETRLRNFIKYAYNSLRAGGLFCGVTTSYNSGNPLSYYTPVMRMKYTRQSMEEYSPVTTWLGCTDGDEATAGVITNTFALNPTTIERVLKEVGFRDVNRKPTLVSEEGSEFFSQDQVDKEMSFIFNFTALK